jgi:hypothetical protein
LWHASEWPAIDLAEGRIRRTGQTQRSCISSIPLEEEQMIRASIAAAIAVSAWVSFGPPALSQDDTDQRFGTVHFATSCNETAQRRFDRAMRYQHSFWYQSSKELFEEVLKADAGCAIAY